MQATLVTSLEDVTRDFNRCLPVDSGRNVCSNEAIYHPSESPSDVSGMSEPAIKMLTLIFVFIRTAYESTFCLCLIDECTWNEICYLVLLMTLKASCLIVE